MNKKQVFVIMPFGGEFYEVYEMLKTALEDEYEFNHARLSGRQQNALKDIIRPLQEADIIIADLTGFDENVLYELGLAHALNKKTILITQDESTVLPPVLQTYRAKNYSTHYKKFSELIKYLKANLQLYRELLHVNAI